MSDNPSKLKIALVVAFYMVAALIMVFVNKAVLNSSPNLPLLMLLIQFIIAVICLHLSAIFSSKIEIPRQLMSLEKFKQLAPILIVNVVGLTFNTLCLRGVDASFFQIARGLVLPLTIAVQAIDAKTAPPIPVLAAAATVTVGFFLGIAPAPASEAAATSSGSGAVALVWGALSSLMTAVHAVLIKRSLPYVDNSAIQLAYWTNATAALMLLPFVFFNGEVASVWVGLGYGQFIDPIAAGVSHPGAVITPPKWDWQTFVFGCLVTGVVGFLLCVAGLLSIKITSPVTHMFSSACRSVLQTLLGVWIFHDILNVNRVSSITVILGGSMYYTWVKAKDTAASQAHRQYPKDDVEQGLLMQPRVSNDDADSSVTMFEAPDDDEPKHENR
ncbi:hypothetical protein M407DRAFT_233786 [Tulasnella calospora MUT 4182]|uniref:Sugar phosphate transporter domain-containing protein n=1 Tax=Tulasnella calospora MUT 4182 TaxID=1051891 RepID=A0A0C3QA46_9AGAM|nr:hypothetical protein M407DRAFT_233786 [Tulasnella calospora MUT 4182]